MYNSKNGIFVMGDEQLYYTQDEYCKKRNYFLEKIGNELENIEISEEVRDILLNSDDEKLEIVSWITKTMEYENTPVMKRAEYFLFKAACTNLMMRVDLFEGYLRVRKDVAKIIGMYNTYLLENILDFQYLCTNLKESGYYRILKILQIIRKKIYINPFLSTEIYKLKDETFVDLLLYSKVVLFDQNIEDEKKIALICDHIKLLTLIDNNDKLKAIYARLYIYSYTDKQILEAINSNYQLDEI